MLSQEKPSMPKPPPKFEQQYFQNITPNFQNVVQHNTHLKFQRDTNVN